MLKMQTGMHWAEIATEHDMRCGACRNGRLELQNVIVNVNMAPTIWYDPGKPWGIDISKPFELPRMSWQQTVTLKLRCELCGVELHLPLHTKE